MIITFEELQLALNDDRGRQVIQEGAVFQCEFSCERKTYRPLAIDEYTKAVKRTQNKQPNPIKGKDDQKMIEKWPCNTEDSRKIGHASALLAFSYCSRFVYSANSWLDQSPSIMPILKQGKSGALLRN